MNSQDVGSAGAAPALPAVDYSNVESTKAPDAEQAGGVAPLQFPLAPLNALMQSRLHDFPALPLSHGLLHATKVLWSDLLQSFEHLACTGEPMRPAPNITTPNATSTFFAIM